MTNIKNILNNAVSLIVVMIVLLLIIPISPFFLDVMIILNISVGLIILLISMNIKEALEFSIFPSLLLITTLYRIGINVSTTRSILSNGGSAGSVIGAMGNFVLQGNAVVGVVIFLIIVLVQFLVIIRAPSVWLRLRQDLPWTRCPVSRWRLTRTWEAD